MKNAPGSILGGIAIFVIVVVDIETGVGSGMPPPVLGRTNRNTR